MTSDVIKSLIESYEKDVLDAKELAKHLTTIPRFLYDSIYVTDEWMQFLPNDDIDAHQITNVFISRLRSSYWIKLFKLYDLRGKIGITEYNELIKRYDSKFTFLIPRFTEGTVLRFLESNKFL